MSNHSVIEHRANYHFIKLEEDYLQICGDGNEYPHCKAFILSILEHWMNDKLAKGQDGYVYMSYPQWIEAMYGLFHRNHIIKCLSELCADELILKRPYTYQGRDSFAYCLNVAEVQKRLSDLEERTERYTRPKIHPFKFKRIQKQTGTDVNLNAEPATPIQIQTGTPFKNKRNIDSSTKNLLHKDTNKEIVGSASATPTPPLAHPLEAKKEEDELTPKETNTDDGLATLPAGHEHRDDSQHRLSGSGQAGVGRVAPLAPKGQQKDTSVKRAVRPRAQASPQASSPSRKSPAPAPAVPSIEAVRIMDDWDAIMKRPVPRTKGHVEAAETLVACNPTREELDACRKWHFTTDDPKKPWYRRIGVGLLDCAKNFDRWQSIATGGKELEISAEEAESTSIWATMTKAQFAAEFYPSEVEKRRIASYAQ